MESKLKTKYSGKVILIIVLAIINGLWAVCASDYTNVLFIISSSLLCISSVAMIICTMSAKLKIMFVPVMLYFLSILMYAISLIYANRSFDSRVELLLAFMFVAHIGMMIYSIKGRENFTFSKVHSISIILSVLAVIICFIPLLTELKSAGTNISEVLRFSLPCALPFAICTLFYSNFVSDKLSGGGK